VVLSDGLVVRRGWAAFTEVELARSAALEELIGAVRGAGLEPRAVLTADGAGVVLRAGLPADADAIAAMHDRCSAVDRFPVGSRSIGPQPMPRRLLNRPLVEPRGRTVVGAVGHQVVALGQLIRTTDPAIAEVSLLVEDDWQGRGLGTELLAELARVARAAGHRELVAWCPPEDTAMLRSASAARLPARTTREGGLLRVTMATTPEVRQTTAT
jgi:GNAT superfamily N-acetyltransferase